MVTFIHLSKNILGNPDTLLLPIGLPALANFLRENGVEAEIIHSELEENRDPGFDLVRYLKANKRRILCFDLHWYYQSGKVIDTIRKIKRNIPCCRIIIGGFTASFFAEEILKSFFEIDFIIRGDSEIPLLKLINQLQSENKNYESIPNLAWKPKRDIIFLGLKLKKGNIRLNEQSYIVTQEIIDNLKFSSFALLKNSERYNRIRLNISIKYQSRCLRCNEQCDKIFYYNCGRGCPVNCSFCGGSNTAQKLINIRPNVILINHSSVIRELKNAYHSGFKEWRMSFDPYPKGDYYIELFKKIRAEKLKFILNFDCWSLPSKNFIDEFAKTFDREKSKIIISPECGSELIRKKHKGYFFSNRDLISVLKYINSKGIKMVLYFVAGLPSEKKEDVIQTLKLINFIRNNFRNIKMRCRPVEFEPASLCFLEREKYGISSNIRNFKDYYKIHKEGCRIEAYDTEYFSKKEIYKIVRLLQAEANCVESQSYFLKEMLRPGFALESYKFEDMGGLCVRCGRFNICNRLSNDYECVMNNAFCV